jgi:hypothetical protein
MRIALALAIVLTACSGSAPPTERPSPAGQFVVPTDLPNGRIEITVSYGYPLGSVAKFPVAISATQGSITGPVAARVNATGFGDRAPSETLLKTLTATPVVVRAGQRLATSVSWDGLDEQGRQVPADYYVLVLDFQIETAGAMTLAKAGTTIEIKAP